MHMCHNMDVECFQKANHVTNITSVCALKLLLVQDVLSFYGYRLDYKISRESILNIYGLDSTKQIVAIYMFITID